MQIEWKFVNNFQNTEYPQKQQHKINTANFLWYNCTQFYRDYALVNISHSTKMGIISFIVYAIWQKFPLCLNPYKIIFCMVAMATSVVRKVLLVRKHNLDILYGCHANKYGEKNILVRKYNLDIRSSFHDGLKRISELWCLHRISKKYLEWYTRGWNILITIG